jgi:hypothetical protein
VDHHDRNFFDDTDLQTSTQGTSLTPSLEIPEPSSSGAGHRKKKNHGISSATNPTSKYQPAVSANAFYTPGGSASSSQAMQSINSADTSPSNSTSATSAPMTRGRGRPSSKAPLSDMPARQISTRRGSKRKVTENAPAVNGSAMDDTHSSKPLDVAEGTVSPVSKKSRGSSEVPPLTTRSTRNKRKATEFSSTTAFNNAVDGPQSSQGLDADDGAHPMKKTRSRSRADSEAPPPTISNPRSKRARQVKSRTTSNASEFSESVSYDTVNSPLMSHSASFPDQTTDFPATTASGRPKRNRRPPSRDIDYSFGKSVGMTGSSRRASDAVSGSIMSGGVSSRRTSDANGGPMDMMSMSNDSRRPSYVDDDINSTKSSRKRRASAITPSSFDQIPKQTVIIFGKGKGKGKEVVTSKLNAALDKTEDVKDEENSEKHKSHGANTLPPHPHLADFRFPAPKSYQEPESEATQEEDAQHEEAQEFEDELTAQRGVDSKEPSDEPPTKRRRRDINRLAEDINSEMGSEDIQDDIENAPEDVHEEQDDGPEIIPLVRKRGRPSTRGRGGKRLVLTRQNSNLPNKKKGGQGKHKQSNNQQIQGGYDRMRELKVAFKELGKIVRAANDTLAEKSIEKMQEDETYHIMQPEYAKVMTGLDGVLTTRITHLGSEMGFKCDQLARMKNNEDDYVKRQFDVGYPLSFI